MHSKIKELPYHKLRVNDMLFGNNPEKFDIKNAFPYLSRCERKYP